MLIDHKQLSPEALQGIIESYIQSNINEAEVDLKMTEWVDKIKSHISKGELVIEFSELNQSVYLKDPHALSVSSESSDNQENYEERYREK
ncbi:YheU family protein [Aliikangiella sp. IMCC44653]